MEARSKVVAIQQKLNGKIDLLSSARYLVREGALKKVTFRLSGLCVYLAPMFASDHRPYADN